MERLGNERFGVGGRLAKGGGPVKEFKGGNGGELGKKGRTGSA